MTDWDPVVVQLPMAGRQTIHGPYAALVALLIEWPERRSAYYRALKLCTSALDDASFLQKAHEAFRHACIQAWTGPIEYPRRAPPRVHGLKRCRYGAVASASAFKAKPTRWSDWRLVCSQTANNSP
jgi:hypothetical protein